MEQSIVSTDIGEAFLEFTREVEDEQNYKIRRYVKNKKSKSVIDCTYISVPKDKYCVWKSNAQSKLGVYLQLEIYFQKVMAGLNCQ